MADVTKTTTKARAKRPSLRVKSEDEGVRKWHRDGARLTTGIDDAVRRLAHLDLPRIDVDRLDEDEWRELAELVQTISKSTYDPEAIAHENAERAAAVARAEAQATEIQAIPDEPMPGTSELFAGITRTLGRRPAGKEVGAVIALRRNDPDVTPAGVIQKLGLTAKETFVARPARSLDFSTLSEGDLELLDRLLEKGANLPAGELKKQRERRMVQAKVAELTRDLEPPKRRRVLESPGVVRLPAELFKVLDHVVVREEEVEYHLSLVDLLYLALVVHAIENQTVNALSRLEGDAIRCRITQPFWNPKWVAWEGASGDGLGNGNSSNHATRNLVREGWLTTEKVGASEWLIGYGPRLKKALDLDEEA